MSHAFDGGIFRVGLKGGFKEWVDGWAEGEGKGGLGALSHGKGGSLYRLLGLDTSALERLLLRLCDALEQSKIQIRAHTNKEGCRSYSRIHTPTHARMRAHTHAHTKTPLLGGMRGALICLGALGSGPPARSTCRWRGAAGRIAVSGTAKATGRACGSTQRQ